MTRGREIAPAGTGFEKSNRAVREEENEDAIGGLRNAARSITKVPGWAVIGAKIAMLIGEIVDRNHDVLAEVLDNLRNKITAHVVPESLCHDLRDKLQSLLGLSRDALTPGPGGLFPELFEGLTLAAQDPDVHIHE